MNKYAKVLRLIKKAAQPNYGGYSYNGRLLDIYGKHRGSYGYPYKGSYGYALDRRSKMRGPNDFFVGSMSLPSGFAGQVSNITESQLKANRRQVASRNAKKLAPNDPQLQSWAATNFRIGGRRNAKSWQRNGTLAPQTTAQDWSQDQNFSRLSPQQQQNFLRVYNGMASNTVNNVMQPRQTQVS